MKKQIKIFYMFLIFILLFPIYAKADNNIQIDEQPLQNEYVRAKVLEVKELNLEEISPEQKSVDKWLEDAQDAEYIEESDEQQYLFFNSKQLVKVEILEGKFKGQTIDIENMLSGNPSIDIKVSQGDEILLLLELNQQGIVNANIADFVRVKYLKYILILFIVMLLLIGGIKGIKTIITLGITILVVYKILLPLILSGYNPVLVTVFVSIFITIIVMLAVGGINSKSISSIIGTIIGVCIAGIIAYFIGNAAKLTGLNMEEAQMLIYIPQNIDFNMKGLLFSGIIIGSLGAVMDVAMSIASSVHEISCVNPNLELKLLIRSGMNVGKDIMGTMSNTLILAYTGSAIPLLLIFMAYNNSFSKIINMDIIATEVVRALAGSIGLIMTIPITAIIAALFCSKNFNKLKKFHIKDIL